MNKFILVASYEIIESLEIKYEHDACQAVSRFDIDKDTVERNNFPK